MHPNNLHKDGYNFSELTACLPGLAKYVIVNKYGKTTIDFAKHQAVKIFNQALLKKYYKIEHWDIPQGYLCPPVPSRSDYLHYVSDLFSAGNSLRKKRILDVGVGANCIYPLIGSSFFNWNFVGSDIDQKVLKVASAIVDINELSKKISFRLQANKNNIFQGIIQKDDLFDAVVCNPPFFESAKQAELANIKKWKKLGYEEKENLNFGGKSDELWCEGGALKFIELMILESAVFKSQVRYFTVLVSKNAYLKIFNKTIQHVKAKSKIIEMEHGHKKTRLLVWWYE